MFTGLIEDIGTLRSRRKQGEEEHLEIVTKIPTSELTLGESIAVNGCCLTVTTITPDGFTAHASSETMRITALGELQQGAKVHLERAMAVGERLGGHIVQGHIDGVGHIERIYQDGKSWQVFIAIPKDLRPEVVHKGSIAVDGVSLTVNTLTPNGCRLTIIPFTGEETLLTRKTVGAKINIETDIIGKYVRHLMRFPHQGQDQEMYQLLQRAGFVTEENR